MLAFILTIVCVVVASAMPVELVPANDVLPMNKRMPMPFQHSMAGELVLVGTCWYAYWFRQTSNASLRAHVGGQALVAVRVHLQLSGRQADNAGILDAE